MTDARWKELRMAMTKQEVVEILRSLLESDLALKPEEKKALKVAIKELTK